MRKILVILALLGGAYWWFSKPPAVTKGTILVPAKGLATPAPAFVSALPTATPPSSSGPAPVRKSPLNSALNIRQTQADRVGKQQKQQQSLP